LIVDEGETHISFDIEYCTDLFTEATIRRMALHYKELLSSIVADRASSIADLSIVTQEEQKELVAIFNDTDQSYPYDKSLATLFNAQVAQTPNNIALTFKDKSYTYQELDEISNRFANYLQSNYTIKVEDFIGIKLDRSDDVIISILAIIKSGGTYVPIDTNYPQDRISYIEQDSNCKAIIDRELLASYQKEALSYKTNLPEVVMNSDALAYVMYTSGSTGTPKGVMVTHQNIVSLCTSCDYIDLSEDTVLLSTGSVSFDATTIEFWGPLLNGGQLIVTDKNTLLNTEKLGTTILDHGVNTLWMTASWFHQVTEENLSVFKGLKYLMVGGDKVLFNYTNKVKECYPDLNIINGYGPTENTTFSTTHLIPAAMDRDIPIGKPIKNSQAYIFDTTISHLQPIGVVGELCLGGSGLSRGYLNQEELTAEKFIDNPLSPGEQLYRTGDLARWLPDGTIEFMGRQDSQVKIRGYRIELGEIENALLEFENIKGCCVEVKEDLNRTKRLVGYVVSTDNFDREIVQKQLQQKLPDYMVPQLWVSLESMPLTSNGKIDKKSLPEPDTTALSSTTYVEASNSIEEQLVKIWQDLLGVEKIGVHDNFFELGGDSIITIQMVSRLKRFGHQIQPRDLFENQTISELEQVITSNTHKIIGEQGILTGTSELLPIQKWYFENVHVANTHFNQSMFLSIDKSVKDSYLEEAVKLIVSQHDALRFRYKQEGEEWIQTYTESEGILIREDLSNANEELSTLISEVCDSYQKSMIVENDQIFKVVLIKTPDSEEMDRLLIIAHHLVIDGVSWRILLEDFYNILDDLINERTVKLAEKSSSFREWSTAIKEYANSHSVYAQLPYWESTISDYQVIPVDKEGQVATQLDMVEYKNTLDEEHTSLLLTEVHKSYATEINDILLSCLAQTINQWSSHTKILIGLEGHGREDIAKHVDISNTIGWFTNLYPVLLAIENEISTENLIKSVKEQLRSIPDKGLGYGALKYLNSSEEVRDRLSKTQWDIIFNYLGQFDSAVSSDTENDKDWFGGAEEFSGQQVGERTPTNSKLEINCSVVEKGLTINWSFSSKEYEATTIEQLANKFLDNLKSLIIHCKEKKSTDLTPSDYGLGKDVGYQELDEFFNEELDSEEIFKF
ncbi:amino acid adenylation domain-containing protein, partial [Aquimarina sp. 2201CG1-2-11]|uniref:amino acid adenylation domain-containing protein n=1 Tax=Aquimarina discodermiae TaxID=3231043 RepID=UPI003461BFA9